MDLTPLYELRERLRAGAIAGAALATEDFRLSRALEGLAPLEKASPVFAKLGQLARSVQAPDCPDRALAAYREETEVLRSYMIRQWRFTARLAGRFQEMA